MKGKKKAVAVALLCVLLAVMLAACGAGKKDKLKTQEDFEHAEVGVMTGSSFDTLLKEYLPDAEPMHFATVADLNLSLKKGKIDGILMDKAFFAPLGWEAKDLTYIEMDMPATKYGIAFPKNGENDQLQQQLNEFIKKQQENGQMEILEEKWFGDTEPTEPVEISGFTGENGTLKVATVFDCKPFAYMKNNQVTGFDLEFLVAFAKEYGYNLDIDVMDFNAMLASLNTKGYDMGAGSITITAEREESVDFSDPYYRSDIVMAVQNDGETTTALTLDDFHDKKIGIMTGTVYGEITEEKYPDAEKQYFTLLPDLIMAVEQGKVDGFVSEVPYYTATVWEGAQVAKIEEPLTQTKAGFIMRKDPANDQMLSQLDKYIIECKDNGTLDQLKEKWFGDKEPEDTALDYDALTAENGTLTIAVAPDLKPLTYMKEGEMVGYEMEILYGFAEKYGYGLEVATMTFDGILSGVTTGKYDIGSAGVTITEERQESVYFTESHLTVDVVMVVKGEKEAFSIGGFFSGLKESFNKTFVREDRWMMLVKGMGVTMLISICAMIAGSLLGFGLYMLARTERMKLRKFVRTIAKIYSRIVEGTPVVVILMILFYVVFGNLPELSGVVVAIIGFTLTFGAFVYDHMNVAIDSVNKGQMEAAYALGYNRNQTFFRIIFPQAMTIFMPTYCGQAVELIKATAIVGYIAVNDLTKMGDIIRSNTYEAFFPLITTAVIYFLLTWALATALGRVKRRFQPRLRSKEEILKGVNAE